MMRKTDIRPCAIILESGLGHTEQRKEEQVLTGQQGDQASSISSCMARPAIIDGAPCLAEFGGFHGSQGGRMEKASPLPGQEGSRHVIQARQRRRTFHHVSNPLHGFISSQNDHGVRRRTPATAKAVAVARPVSGKASAARLSCHAALLVPGG
jgi:hypothetical protein